MADFSVSGCALRALATGCSQDRLNNLAHERLAPIQGVSVMPSSNTLIVTPQSSGIPATSITRFKHRAVDEICVLLTNSKTIYRHPVTTWTIYIYLVLYWRQPIWRTPEWVVCCCYPLELGGAPGIASSRPRSQYNRVKPAVRAEIVPGRDRRNPSMELRLTDMSNAFVRSNHLRTFL